ncbi:GntR family transcriptional regulator [Paraburkholderia sp. SARCC-3016]|uniref:GntR family transcriptional regulator n=1 Tax=Paraburkholderia sp. SARCC-3016 TaxID=3058611 RepID=UPI00280A16EC|nr:GntR family transcriptional regulator [Paraburkholderia sp. SARCC-3016]MDQ7976238.1 GntR family transcriptional regulator [Paraburkholderia sp. SARCC-3016]
MIEKTAAATLSGELAERIRQDLLDGVLVPGSRINEVSLSRELAVSRTPLRSALQMLAGEGLLTYTPNRGFTVRAFPLSEIVDAYEMRALAEGLAARLAAERGLSADACVQLENALARGDEILAGDAEPNEQRANYAEVNEVFHSVIHQAASSRLVSDVLRVCQQIPQASTHNILAFEIDDIRERHRFHHRIYDAILAREPREAETLMRQHVVSVKTSLIRATSRHLNAAQNESASAGRRKATTK